MATRHDPWKGGVSNAALDAQKILQLLLEGLTHHKTPDL